MTATIFFLALGLYSFQMKHQLLLQNSIEFFSGHLKKYCIEKIIFWTHICRNEYIQYMIDCISKRFELTFMVLIAIETNFRTIFAVEFHCWCIKFIRCSSSFVMIWIFALSNYNEFCCTCVHDNFLCFGTYSTFPDVKQISTHSHFSTVDDMLMKYWVLDLEHNLLEKVTLYLDHFFVTITVLRIWNTTKWQKWVFIWNTIWWQNGFLLSGTLLSDKDCIESGTLLHAINGILSRTLLGDEESVIDLEHFFVTKMVLETWNTSLSQKWCLRPGTLLCHKNAIRYLYDLEHYLVTKMGFKTWDTTWSQKSH